LRSLTRMLLQLKFEVGLIVDRYPTLYRFWWHISPKSNLVSGDLLVNKETEIVIEGFPRSGNSFAYAAFLLANGPNRVVSHHVHRPSQIITASRNGIPTMIIIRQPAEAVTSLNIFRPYLSLKQGLRSYIDFYERVKPYRDSYLLTTFENVTDDFGNVVKQLNNKFQTSFSVFEHTDENVKKCFAMVEQFGNQYAGYHDENLVGRPSEKRKIAKLALQAQLKDKSLQPLLSRAKCIYDWYIANAGT